MVFIELILVHFFLVLPVSSFWKMAKFAAEMVVTFIQALTQRIQVRSLRN